MTLIRYYLKDAFQGMKRNAKAFFATVLLIFISLAIMGSFLLVKQSVDGVIGFLDTQIKIKVFLTEGADTKQINEAIKEIPNVKSTSIETKQEMLDQMKGFFKGKEYLFDAFQQTDFPATILIDAKDDTQVDGIADRLKQMEGIQDVVYPQTFAKEVLKWTNILNQYGAALLVVFLIISFLTTQLAISLSLYQRQKEIKVKLLLGAKEKHVQRQFLFEGWAMAFIGSVFASLLVYVIQRVIMNRLYQGIPMIFQDVTNQMNVIVLVLMLVGSAVGIIAAYIATRGMMKNA